MITMTFALLMHIIPGIAKSFNEIGHEISPALPSQQGNQSLATWAKCCATLAPPDFLFFFASLELLFPIVHQAPQNIIDTYCINRSSL
jgi:hypothetical protein